MNRELSTVRRRRGALAGLFFANVAYASLLIILALIPRVPSSVEEVPDVIAHAIAYGLQALLLFSLLQKMLPGIIATLFACLGAFMLGVLTEGLQLVQPSRASQSADVVANGIGIAVAAAAILAASRIRRPRVPQDE